MKAPMRTSLEDKVNKLLRRIEELEENIEDIEGKVNRIKGVKDQVTDLEYKVNKNFFVLVAIVVTMFIVVIWG